MTSPAPADLRARMADIESKLTSARGCDAATLARRAELECEHREIWHTLYTMGEDPPRRSNGYGRPAG